MRNPIRKANKPTDGVSVIQPRNKPKPIKYKDPSEEVLIMVAELIRSVPGGASQQYLQSLFVPVEPTSTKAVENFVSSTLRDLSRKGIVTKHRNDKSRFELTKQGYEWARDIFERISLNPLPPRSNRSNPSGKVIPFNR